MNDDANLLNGPPTLLEVGRITRVHGLRGEVTVDLTSNVEGRLAAGSVLHTGPDETSPHLTIESSRCHQDKWLVRFAGATTRETAELLGRPRLYAAPIDDPDAVWLHELFDAVVVDGDGIERGIVVEVIDNPASELLQLDTGHLVPIQFVDRVEGNQVIVTVPDGLWDL